MIDLLSLSPRPLSLAATHRRRHLSLSLSLCVCVCATMSLQRISSRFPTTLLARRLNSLIFANSPHTNNHFLLNYPNKVVTGPVSPLRRLGINSPVQQFGFSSSMTAKTDEKRTDSEKEVNNMESKSAAAESSADAEVADQRKASSSDGPEDLEEELTTENLIKLVSEKDELLKVKHKEIENMKEKVLRSYAEMENVMDRTRREAENSKKFAIQSFAKGLLDVADNLGRASSVVKESFSKIDTSKDSAGAAPLLKALLEGVEMTEKQLTEVFKKFGVEKYDPTGEQFDPNRHNAVFQVPDASKPPGTVAVVLKLGYVLHDRVIRPAEVGVTEAVLTTETDQGLKE